MGVDYIAAIQDGPDAKGLAESIHRVLDGDSQGFRWEYPCHSPDEKHWFEMKVGPLQGVGAIIVHSEVTARIQAESAVRNLWFETQKRLQTQRTNRRLGDLLNHLSHELATPLTPLMLQVAACRGSLTDPKKMEEHLGKVENQLRRMSESLDHLRDRMSAMHASPASSDATARIADVVQRSLAGWTSQAEKRSIRLDVDAPDERVRIDPNTLRFVLDSLIGEAMHMTPAQGTISLRCRPSKDHHRLEVRHSGGSWELTDRTTLDEALEPYDSTLETVGPVTSFTLPTKTEEPQSP